MPFNYPTTEKRRSFQLPASVAAAQHRSTVVECGYASVNQPLPQPVKIKTYSTTIRVNFPLPQAYNFALQHFMVDIYCATHI
jgi:hypothetical protein